MTEKYRATVRFESVDDDKETFERILRDMEMSLEGRTINWKRGNTYLVRTSGGSADV